jgi:ABC-2 type transport system permease protein
MGVAFTCGLQKVTVPFIDRGIPVEYELVRSIATVTEQKRKKVGVLTTDAKLYGTFDMQTGSLPRNELIIEELQKQYDVVQVDPTNPITEKYDVLLAVQPSSLTPPQLENFIAAVKSGQPTAIFEDPFPFIAGDVPGTKAPKQPPGGGNPFMQQRMPPQPKGDIAELWKLLGVDFGGDNVVWQDYNPLPKMGGFVTPEWVFVDHDSGAKQPFNSKNSITSKLQQVLFLFPGAMTGLNSSPLKFTELVSTNDHTGTIRYDQILERSFMGPPRMNPEMPLLRKPTNDKYVLAAQIRGKLKPETVPMSDKPAEVATDKPATESAAETKPADANSEAKAAPSADAKTTEKTDAKTAETKEPEINVIVVSDIDCLYSAFFALRARGDDPDAEMELDFDNVPFVLNVLDVLANDERFVEIRTRRPVHRTLSGVNEKTQAAKEQADKARDKFVKDFEKTRAKAQKEFDDQIAELKKREGINAQQAAIEILTKQQSEQRR